MSETDKTKDYKNTLILPQTDFPMKANLAAREPGFLKFWEDIDCYGKMQEKNKGKKQFILHDGPPYANGNIHIGTAFNKILKDFFPKYMSMRGYYSPYVPGWDTHGLPIELRVLKEMGLDKDEVDTVELRRRCAEYALKYIDIQRAEFKRLGVFGDWDNPYITLKSEYEAAQLELFGELIEKKLVYKGLKPVFWCTDCRTALAAAEIEYEDESSPSIFVAYPIKREHLAKYDILKGRDTYCVIWTTTPWTLPASMAIAIHPEYSYGFYEAPDGRILLMAAELSSSVATACEVELKGPVLTVKGKELEGVIAAHPFYEEREIAIVNADYVVLDSGSGCVHTAPGHGVEDFETGVRYGIDIYNPIDDRGVFFPGTGLVGGKPLEEANKLILQTLTDSGRLVGSGKIMHSYPHCWRCKKPVIFRATAQWFIAVKDFKAQALDAISKVEWIPSWGEERITNMVRERSDWCISRQRVWGVPIPAFSCTECGEILMNIDTVKRVAEHVRTQGSSVWWQKTPEEFLGDMCVCKKCGSSSLKKEKDIMDVWFDSGSSQRAVLKTRPELSWPAELYLEGSDQHRGWFQTSLLTSVAAEGCAPFKAVLTHGFIMDGSGHKMSKSLGNVVAPNEIIDKYGADILRLWVASTDYRNDVRISATILQNLSESYRRIRNTAKFMLGNLADFNPSKDIVETKDLRSADAWLISRLNDLIYRVTKGYDEYAFHMPVSLIHQFCDNELSSFYLDINKDRLYADAKDALSRRSVQTVMWHTLLTLTKMLAPLLSFTTEEIWQQMIKIDASLPESVFLSDWPSPIQGGQQDEQSGQNWQKLLEARGAVLRALEGARSKGVIGKSLEADIVICLAEKYEELAQSFDIGTWELATLVSNVTLDADLSGEGVFEDEETKIKVRVSKSTCAKCPRCWKQKPEVADLGLCSRCNDVVVL